MPYLTVDKREYLFRPWILLLVVLAFIAVFLLLMPRNDFLRDLKATSKPDNLSVAYLQALVKAEPDNDVMRLTYVEHLIGTGKIDEAERQLQFVDSHDSSVASSYALHSLKIAVLRHIQHPDDIRLRLRTEAAATDLFNLPFNAISTRQLEQLTTLLLQAGLPGWAAKGFLRRSFLDIGDQQQWLSKAAAYFVAAGRTDEAGMVQLRLSKISGDVEDAIKAVDYMLAGQEPEQAMRVLPYLIATFPENRKLLQLAMRVAQSQQQFALADKWGMNWMRHHLNDTGIMRDYVHIAVATGHPQAASWAAATLVRLRPDDAELRRQLAQISDWTSHPAEALHQWQWLADHQHDRAAFKRALKLAVELHDYRAANILLAKARGSFGLTRSEMSVYAEIEEELGNPEKSEAVRLRYLRQFPQDRTAWEQLAMLREHLGKLKEAVSTWALIKRRFGHSEISVIHHVLMLDAIEQPEAGLVVLQQFSESHAPESEAYWRLFAALSWNLEHQADAIKAYRWLWNHENGTVFDVQRLVMLLQQEGDVKGAGVISEQAWDRLHRPGMLLTAIESAMTLADWQNVTRLTGTADKQKELFIADLRYWLLHARWQTQMNQFERVEHDYRAALQIAPQNDSARTGLLWLWIQTAQQKKLKYYLAQWQWKAWTHEAYWRPYAAAYRLLGRDRAALPWFRQSIQGDQDDMLWMLEYADALAASGQASGAWRLRQYLLIKAGAKNPLSNAYMRKHDIEAAEAVMHLQRRLLGLPHAEQWIKQLITHRDDPAVRALASRWYFSVDHDDLAIFWMLRQHAKRLKQPLWQQLAVAMKRNDLDRISKIISGRNNVDPISRMLSFSQLKQMDDALGLTLNTDQGAGRRDVVQRTMQLRMSRDRSEVSPNAMHVARSFKRVGALDIGTLEAKGFYSRHNVTFSIRLKRNNLTAGFPDRKHYSENELKLTTTGHMRRGDLVAYAGVNQRINNQGKTDQLIPWGAQFTWWPWQGGKFGLSLAMNEVSMESSGFRLVGARDQLKLSVSSDVTKREFIAMDMNLNRYQTRIKEILAKGYGGNVILGHRLMMGNSMAEDQMQISMNGSYTRNQLHPGVSRYVQQIVPGATVASVIAPVFSSLGVGFQMQRDQPGNDAAIARMPIYRFNAWSGWQWPSQSLGYSIDMAIGLPVFGRDMLSLQAYVVNSSLGSPAGQSTYGMTLMYSYRLDQ